MTKAKFKITITSVPDKERLVAEIWYEDDFIAQVSNEDGFYEVEFFADEQTNIMPLENLLVALQDAQARLENAKQ